MSLVLRDGVYRMRKTIKGVRTDRSTGTADYEQAKLLEARWISEMYTEVVIKEKKPISLHKAIDEFTKSRSNRPSYENVINRIKTFKTIKDKWLHKVTLQESSAITEAMLEEGMAPSTVNNTVAYWNAMLKFAEKKGHSTCARLERQKGVKGKLRWLTKAEEGKLLSAVEKQDDKDFVCLLLDTGARYNEIAKLRWNQVDLPDETVFIERSKGGDDTTMAMTDRAKEILERRFAEKVDGQVFHRQHKNEQYWWDKAVAKAELALVPSKPSFHTTRHTFSVRFLKDGGGLHELKGLLGHKTLDSTMVYAHFVQSDASKKAAGIMNKLHENRPRQGPRQGPKLVPKQGPKQGPRLRQIK